MVLPGADEFQAVLAATAGFKDSASDGFVLSAARLGYERGAPLGGEDEGPPGKVALVQNLIGEAKVRCRNLRLE